MKNKKSAIIMASLSSLLLLVCLQVSAATDQTQVKVEPGFYEKYKDYLDNSPSLTAFNGGGASNLEKAIPFYKMPFTAFVIDLKSEKSSYPPGEKITLDTELSYQYKGAENLNKIKTACLVQLKDESKCAMPKAYKFPELNNLGIFVQVWRKDKDSAGANKGDFLVDEFYALENQNLKNGENKNFPINWTIPSGQKDGDYYFMVYLNQDKSFDLVGTPLVVSSEAKRFDFQIYNDKKVGLEIDKNNIKVNGADYAYRRPAPTVNGKEISISVPLQNLGSITEQANVKYELYRWGRINPKDLLDSKTDNKTMQGSSKETLNYSFTPNEVDSVYDLKIVASNNDSKTTAYVRFVVEGKNRGIFRFLSFVEDKGQFTPMFCIRNASWNGSFQGKVRLTLGNEKIEQEGTIAADEGNCYVLKNSLTAKNTCSNLRAEILNQAGKVVDEKEISINCGETKKGASAGKVVNASSADSNFLYIVAVTIILLAILIGGIIILKLKNKNNEKSNPL